MFWSEWISYGAPWWRCWEQKNLDAMKELFPFEKAFAHLQNHKVQFIVCGGLAVAFCGFVRVTEDIDILVSTERATVERLLTALSTFGDGLGGTLSPDDFTLEPGCFEINERECRIDIFTLMDGKTYEELLPEAQTFQAKNLNKPLIHLNKAQLISAKSSTYRDKDRIDVDALRKLQRQEDKAF
ncbi:MAG: hypothetical protein AAF558_01580 [Verrucomicrobiota bacterium]